MAIWVVEKKLRKMVMITVPVMKKSLQVLLVFQPLLQEPPIDIDRWQAYLSVPFNIEVKRLNTKSNDTVGQDSHTGRSEVL